MAYFKFRAASQLPRDIDALVENYFYAPTAAELNDPCEAVINEMVVKKFASVLGSGIQDPLQALLDLRYNVGVYSLSGTVRDELMWSYYAESHLGLCIEYDPSRLLIEPRTQWTPISVRYSNVPPEIDFSDLSASAEEVTRKLIGCKSHRWRHEEETRIVTATPGKNYYAQASVIGIYFGCRCDERNVEFVRKKLSGRGIKYYRMEYPAASYSLDLIELEYDSSLDGEPFIHVAPVLGHAVPDPAQMGKYAHLHSKLIKAVERVRRDPSCVKVELAEVSTSGENEGKLFVTFQSSVKTSLYDRVNWFFDPADIAA